MKWRYNENRAGKPVKVSGLLGDFLKEFKLESRFTVESLKEVWEDICGNIIASHSIPDRIYQNVLFVKADHPVFANDLSMMSGMLLKKIHTMFSGCDIKYIKVEIKKDLYSK